MCCGFLLFSRYVEVEREFLNLIHYIAISNFFIEVLYLITYDQKTIMHGLGTSVKPTFISVITVLQDACGALGRLFNNAFAHVCVRAYMIQNLGRQ